MASAKVIPPGGEGKIEVTFKTKGRHGSQSKTVTVISNDPEQPNLKLSISADIIIKFGFEVPKLGLGRLKKDELKAKTVTAVGEELPRVKILSVSLANTAHEKYYKYETSDTGEGDLRKIVFSITPTREIPIGRFRDVLVIKTNLKDVEEVKLHLSGEILGPIEIMPRALMMRSESDSAPFVGSVTLKPTTAMPFQVLSAECEDSGPSITVHAPGPDGSIKIEMSLPADFGKENFRSNLIIRTDLPEQSESSIPVYSSPRRPRSGNSGDRRLDTRNTMSRKLKTGNLAKTGTKAAGKAGQK